jgi:hypothetical protein
MLGGSLPDALDLSMEGGAFGLTAVVHETAFFYNFGEFCLYFLQLCEVFILDLCVLNLNYGQVFFIFLRELSEPLSELVGFLVIQSL